MYRFDLEELKSPQPLKIKAVPSFETSKTSNPSGNFNNLEDLNPQLLHYGKLECQISRQPKAAKMCDVVTLTYGV
jgi:hypothetical protein